MIYIIAEIFQNREQNTEHVGINIEARRTQFSCIAVALAGRIVM